MNEFPNREITISDEPLCDECKELGYCKETLAMEKRAKASSYIPEELPKVEMLKENKNVSSLKELLNLVPLHAHKGRFGDYTKKHLQTAYDAFHQEDYETALLNFLTVLETNSNVSDAFLGTAICYYMLGDFEKALGYSHYLENISRVGSELLLKSFFDLCATEKKKVEVNEGVVV